MKIYRPTGEEVFKVLESQGFRDYFKGTPYLPHAGYIIGPFTVTGVAQIKIIWEHLRSEKMKQIFHEGNLHKLHADVGKRRTDFRSYKGKICPGSLQFVIDLDSGRFYSDIDAWNPYQDAINWFGHTFGEVIIPKLLGKEEVSRNG